MEEKRQRLTQKLSAYPILSKKEYTSTSAYYKTAQNLYNKEVLYIIKKRLKAGTIQIEKNSNMAEFRIRDKASIGTVTLPIYDKYPLLTSKYFYYEKFKRAYYILINEFLTVEEKNNKMLKLKSENI